MDIRALAKELNVDADLMKDILEIEQELLDLDASSNEAADRIKALLEERL